MRRLMILTWLLVWLVSLVPAAEVQAEEATEAVVQSIAVRGNEQVPAEEILDRITATRIGRPVDPEALQKDAQAILDLGTIESVSFQMPVVPGGIQLVFVVDELPVLSQVVIEGLETMDPDGLLAETGLETGQVLNLHEVQNALATIQYQALEQEGLLIRPTQNPTWDEEGILTLYFAPVRLNQVRVQGNEKTLDYVILREMRIQPGDPIDLKVVDRGLRDVLQLGFFDQVSRSFEETGDPETLDLVVHVQERKTGTASLGVTWSSPGGFGGYVDVADANFLGRGQEAGVKVSVGRSSTEYELRFREPYLTDSGLSLGLSVFNRNRVETEHPAESWYHDLGASVSLGHPVGSYSRLIGTLSMDTRTYDEEAPEFTNTSYRAFELALATDTTDHPFFPTEGYRNRASVTFGGGLLGGDWDHQIYQETFSKYIKVGSSNQTLAFRLDAGFLDGEARQSEQFWVGGSESLRGYDYGQFVGDAKLVANAEYRFPIADQVQGVFFVDAGRAWEDTDRIRLEDMEVGYGFGIRLNTPIGMLRLDYGMSQDRHGQPYISIGQTF